MEGLFFLDRDVSEPRKVLINGVIAEYPGIEDGVFFEGSIKVLMKPSSGFNALPLGRIINNRPVSIPFFSKQDVKALISTFGSSNDAAALSFIEEEGIDGDLFVKFNIVDFLKAGFSQETTSRMVSIVRNTSIPNISYTPRYKCRPRKPNRKGVLDKAKHFICDKVLDLHCELKVYVEYFCWLIKRLDKVDRFAFRKNYKQPSLDRRYVGRPYCIEKSFFLPMVHPSMYPEPECAPKARAYLRTILQRPDSPAKTLLMQCFEKVAETHKLMSPIEPIKILVQPGQKYVKVELDRYQDEPKTFAEASNDFSRVGEPHPVTGGEIYLPATNNKSFNYAIMVDGELIAKVICFT